MASTIIFLLATAILLSLATYCLFNPPRNRIRRRFDQRASKVRSTSHVERQDRI
jgi:peptidoglycan/LPS O-acetylase OafA/YrhL